MCACAADRGGLADRCGGWMIAFDARQGLLYLVLGVVMVPVIVLLRVKPGWAAAGLLAVTATEWVLGGPVQTAGGLLPVAVSFYALGRYSLLQQGLIFFGLFQVMLAGSGGSGWTFRNLPFGVVLLGGPWLFGWLVRHRIEKAVAADQMLAAQALLDPTALATAVVAEERIAACCRNDGSGSLRGADHEKRCSRGCPRPRPGRAHRNSGQWPPCDCGTSPAAWAVAPERTASCVAAAGPSTPHIHARYRRGSGPRGAGSFRGNHRIVSRPAGATSPVLSVCWP